jgi:pyrroline-5-carboxylate reductase
MVRIALLGAGNMGRAILEGLLASENSISLAAYDALPDVRDALPYGIDVLPPIKWFDGNNAPDAIILAVKPADIATAGNEIYSCIKSAGTPAPLIISIAAGVSIEYLRKCTSDDSRICRVMPNIALKVGEGMSAYACSSTCTPSDCDIVETVFARCGRVVAVPEKLLHAITGLSGSGPAYTFLFIEALIEGAVSAGLPMNVARECAVQTVLGAAKMVQQSNEHTGALKAAVMSPGGTTAAGLRALEKGAFKYAVIDAVLAATGRSAELGG